MLRPSRLLIVLFLCAAAGVAQGDRDPVFRADTRLVVLHATVVDRSGKLLTDLPQKAFRVFENGVEQKIRIFRREDVPVSLGLVIDNSASMREKRQAVAAAAMRLVKASNREDQVFIVNFNDEAYLDCPLTNDLAKMEEALDRIDQRGSTAMRDAISMSIDYVRAEGKLDKKALLVVTDGEDNSSSTPLETVVQKAQRAEVLVYVIGLLNDEDRRAAKRAQRAIEAITTASGGLHYFPRDLGEVEQIALRVAHEIRNQYTIAYSPALAELDGSYRQIRVTVDAPNRPVVRTRTGYYATPEPPAKPAARREAAH